MMNPNCTPNVDLPAYDRGGFTLQELLTASFPINATEQLLKTTAPYLRVPVSELTVLDVGCGYGGMSLELGKRCRRVVGMECSSGRLTLAEQMKTHLEINNVEFRQKPIEELSDIECYDLVVLDNVLEHLPDQPAALRNMVRSLRPGGVLYILVPNKLWPIEHHYRLPFLGYLPVPLANFYLRATRRGRDYTDASYAPTYFRLNRLLRQFPELSFQYVPPADISLAIGGASWRYRYGVAAIRRFPWLWVISKSLLVVAVKRN
ncbi:MAG: class I SAM-dependent methyltransferase [Pirellulaceae bacterium]|nr:class I SAM-dependent methyltransferase [Pirellulaceae bacterium]